MKDEPGKLTSLPKGRWKQVTLIATFQVTLIMVFNKIIRMEEEFLMTQFLSSWVGENKKMQLQLLLALLCIDLQKQQQNWLLHAKNRKPYLILSYHYNQLKCNFSRWRQVAILNKVWECKKRRKKTITTANRITP